MSSPIRYGPRKYAGLELQHISDTQGGLKIQALIEHLRAQDESGTDMLIQLSVLQLDAGIC